MFSYIVIGVIFLLLAIFSVVMIFQYIRRPTPEGFPDSAAILRPFEKQPTPVIELREISKLNNWNFFENLQALIRLTHLAEKNPQFYSKFQELYQTHMDGYLWRLMEALGRDNPRLYDVVNRRYGYLSIQEMLLIMLMDTNLLNREMAEIVCTPLETHKKRKLRLKAKLKDLGGIPSTPGRSTEKSPKKPEK